MREHVLRLPPPAWLNYCPSPDRFCEIPVGNDPLRLPSAIDGRESEKANEWEGLWIDLGGEG